MAMASTAEVVASAGLGAWGRLKRISEDPAAGPRNPPPTDDDVYFTLDVTKVGRSPDEADVVVNRPFISSVHCILRKDICTEENTISVTLHDLSRNGIYVDGRLVGKSNSVRLQPKSLVHFTRPNLSPTAYPPLVYEFELLQNLFSVEAGGDAQITTETAVTSFGDSTLPLTGASPKRRHERDNDHDKQANAKILRVGTTPRHDFAAAQLEKPESRRQVEREVMDLKVSFEREREASRRRLEDIQNGFDAAVLKNGSLRELVRNLESDLLQARSTITQQDAVIEHMRKQVSINGQRDVSWNPESEARAHLRMARQCLAQIVRTATATVRLTMSNAPKDSDSSSSSAISSEQFAHGWGSEKSILSSEQSQPQLDTGSFYPSEHSARSENTQPSEASSGPIPAPPLSKRPSQFGVANGANPSTEP